MAPRSVIQRYDIAGRDKQRGSEYWRLENATAVRAIRRTMAFEGGADIPVCSRISSREMNLGLHQIQVVGKDFDSSRNRIIERSDSHLPGHVAPHVTNPLRATSPGAERHPLPRGEGQAAG